MDRRLIAAPPASHHSPGEPLSLPPIPPLSQSGERGWLSGLISGAGKFISSLLDSDSELSSSSSECTGEDFEDGFNEGEDASHIDKINNTLDQITSESQPLNDWVDGSLAIFSEVETKYAIQQLILQETFTRNECNKLTEIIESRVVDRHLTDDEQCRVPSGAPHLSFHNTVACQGVSQCLDHDSDISEITKWLDSKVTSPHSKSFLDYGVFTFNRNLIQSTLESEAGSPVDVAKAYMRAMSARQSPIMSTCLYNGAPDGKTLCCTDETTQRTTFSPNFLPKKVWKRNISSVSGNALRNPRRVRLKSVENKSNISPSELDGLSNGYFEQETFPAISASDQREVLHRCTSLSEPFHAIGHNSLEILTNSEVSERLPVVRVPFQANPIGLRYISDPGADLHAIQPTWTSKLISFPSEPTHLLIESNTRSSDTATTKPAENQVAGESLMTEKQLPNTSVPMVLHPMDPISTKTEDLIEATLSCEQPADVQADIKYVLRIKSEPCVETEEGPSTSRLHESVKASCKVTSGNSCEINNSIPSCQTDNPGIQQNDIATEPQAQNLNEIQPRKYQNRVKRSVGRPRRGRGR